MKRLCVLLIGLIFASTAFADAVSEGFEAFQRKDWSTAFQLWQPEATAGDVRAQFYLSILYEQGMGVDKSPDLARNWLIKAAEGGFPPAQFNLGNWHQQGDWVEKDDSKSVYWWEEAAKRGFTKAQYNLASFYYLGRGVEQNLEQAIFWYREAAKGGSDKAKETLARLGVPAEQLAGESEMSSATQSGQVVEAVSSYSAQTQEESQKNTIKNNEKDDQVNVEINKSTLVEKESTKEQVLVPDWILSQPADNLTVQLFASDKIEGAEEIANRLKGMNEVAIYQYKRFGQQWYAVIYGSFPSLEEAKSAVETLPVEIQRNKPWIRSFGLIQDAVKMTSM